MRQDKNQKKIIKMHGRIVTEGATVASDLKLEPQHLHPENGERVLVRICLRVFVSM